MRVDVVGGRQAGRDGGLVRGVPVHGVGAAPRRPPAGVVVVRRIGWPGACRPKSAPSSSSACAGACRGSTRTSFIARSPFPGEVRGGPLPAGVLVVAPLSGAKKSAHSARKIFPVRPPVEDRRPGGRGRRGKGSGHMMGRWYPPPSPPTVHPTGRVSGGRGEALAPISAAGRRRGPGPGGGRARRRRGGDEGVRGRGEPRPRGASSLPAREKCTLSDPGRLGSERRGPQLVGGLASYDPGGGRSG